MVICEITERFLQHFDGKVAAVNETSSSVRSTLKFLAYNLANIKLNSFEYAHYRFVVYAIRS